MSCAYCQAHAVMTATSPRRSIARNGTRGSRTSWSAFVAAAGWSNAYTRHAVHKTDSAVVDVTCVHSVEMLQVLVCEVRQGVYCTGLQRGLGCQTDAMACKLSSKRALAERALLTQCFMSDRLVMLKAVIQPRATVASDWTVLALRAIACFEQAPA